MYEEIPLSRDRVTVTLPKDCVEWLDEQVKSRIFHNRSHAVEVVILKAMRAKELDIENEGNNERG
jgi:Arc/MetJ-type ribon-helix-helix transcriptional regulator